MAHFKVPDISKKVLNVHVVLQYIQNSFRTSKLVTYDLRGNKKTCRPGPGITMRFLKLSRT